MTEKRFNDAKGYIYDKKTCIGIIQDDYTCENVVDLLNEQDATIQHLKEVIRRYEYSINLKERTNTNLHLDNLKLEKENEQLKEENRQFKLLLQDMGLLMSDEKTLEIRNEISEKLLKPLLKGNGFDVDVDTSNGFKIIPKGSDVE